MTICVKGHTTFMVLSTIPWNFYPTQYWKSWDTCTNHGDFHTFLLSLSINKYQSVLCKSWQEEDIKFHILEHFCSSKNFTIVKVLNHLNRTLSKINHQFYRVVQNYWYCEGKYRCGVCLTPPKSYMSFFFHKNNIFQHFTSRKFPKYCAKFWKIM